MKKVRSVMTLLCMLILSSCDDVNNNQMYDDYVEKIHGSIGKEVTGQIVDVVYVPAEHLEWPDAELKRHGDTTFTRVTLKDGACYLLPPEFQGKMDSGQQIHGFVSAEFVKRWPIEVLSYRCPPLSERRAQ